MQPTIMTQDHYSKQELHFLETDSNKNIYLCIKWLFCLRCLCSRYPCSVHIKIDPVTTLNGVQIVVSDAVRDHGASVTPTLDSGLVAHLVTRYLGGIIRQYLVSGGSISHRYLQVISGESFPN